MYYHLQIVLALLVAVALADQPSFSYDAPAHRPSAPVRVVEIIRDDRVHPAADGSYTFDVETQDGIVRHEAGGPGGAQQGSVRSVSYSLGLFLRGISHKHSLSCQASTRVIHRVTYCNINLSASPSPTAKSSTSSSWPTPTATSLSRPSCPWLLPSPTLSPPTPSNRSSEGVLSMKLAPAENCVSPPAKVTPLHHNSTADLSPLFDRVLGFFSCYSFLCISCCYTIIG